MSRATLPFEEPVPRQPSNAGAAKKGDCYIMKGRPCKIQDKSTAKTGKHGSAKCSITGIDVLNGNKIIESAPSSASMWAFQPRKLSYEVAFVSEDGTSISMLDEDANEIVFSVRENSDPNGYLPKIREALNAGQVVTIFLLSAPVEDSSADDQVRTETIIDEFKAQNA